MSSSAVKSELSGSTPSQNSAKVYDCTKCYHPNRMERALLEGAQILLKGKGGDKERCMKPRLKHRRDGRKYVSKQTIDGKYPAWSTGVYGEGFVTSPKYVNPNRGENALSKTTLDVLLGQIEDENISGVVGKFNSEPVCQYQNLHILYPEESCVWRPWQFLTWGKLENDEFIALKEVIEGKPLSPKQLLELVREKVPGECWQKFSKRVSKKNFPKSYELDDILASKLVANAQTFQRTSLNNNNCFGIALHQFGMCIETKYLYNLEEMWVNLVINRRDPIKDRKYDAKLRFLNTSIEPQEVVSEVEEVEDVEEDTFTYEE